MSEPRLVGSEPSRMHRDVLALLSDPAHYHLETRVLCGLCGGEGCASCAPEPQVKAKK